MSDNINVAFIGNPNCGKTTLFNAYTGAKLKVANWPGVTVEKKEGISSFGGKQYKMVDLPGTYSLTSYTMEEKVSREYIMSGEADVVVDVVDVSALERNLYLTLQLIELGKPMVLALNMMDIAKERGMRINVKRLSELLQIPVVPVSARKRIGLKDVMEAVRCQTKKVQSVSAKNDFYSADISEKLEFMTAYFKQRYPETKNPQWYALKIMENDEKVMNEYPIDTAGILDVDYEKEIIREKYDFIEHVVRQVTEKKQERDDFTDRVDKVLTHRIFAIPIFLVIMAAVFFLTFTFGDFLKGGFEYALDFFSGLARTTMQSVGVNDVLISLTVDGIIAGVGGILTFLPNIIILFFALAILEDSGYMSRAAYIMDDIMRKMGLSGRAFIPMILGLGCSVPAIMASRTLENRRDRLRTILITPFMSCSARLPIYILFSSAFFGEYAMIAAYSMYLISIAVALLMAFFMGKASGTNENSTLLIELPDYKQPNGRTVFIYVWDKVKDYLTRAGTIIFVASIIMWFVMNFGISGLTDNMSESFGAMLGHVLVPIFAPAGLGYWQIILALISGIAAKEVVVSSMSVLLGISNVSSAAGMADMSAVLGQMGFGTLNAYAFMVFCLLYVPCIATVATIGRETRSFKWAAFSVVMQLAVAWIAAVLIFQIGSLFIG